MKITLNGRDLSENIKEYSTLGQTLLQVSDEHIRQDEVISTILLDGEPLTADTLSQWKDRPIVDFQEARIDAPQKNVLASNSLRILAEGLAASQEDREIIVQHIHQGRAGEAMKLLPGYLQIWESLQQSLASAERLLEIDMNTIEIYGLQPPAGAQWETTQVVDQIHMLSQRLAEMKQALESSDLVMLGDIIDYEFNDLTQVWQTILLELADRVGPEPA